MGRSIAIAGQNLFVVFSLQIGITFILWVFDGMTPVAENCLN
ncbi:hypothetical protein NIES3974_22640 [Calothrix sp. NIES-3974]|nr:hypothetical protein NIES3974_22640 [Calothrix sp. NIES-3974]